MKIRLESGQKYAFSLELEHGGLCQTEKKEKEKLEDLFNISFNVI